MPIPITTTSAGMTSFPQLTALDRRFAFERRDFGGKPQVDAAGSMSARVVGGHLGSSHSPEYAVRGFDDADLEPQTFRGRCNLEADVPSAHDDQSPPRHQRATNGVRVLQRPQVEDVSEIGTGDVEPAWTTSRRDDEVGKRQRLAVFERHRAAIRVDIPDRVAQPELDVVLGVEAFRAQEYACQRKLA